MFDITAARHLLVNETAEDGVREIKEELGIGLNFCNLHYLATIPNSIHLEGFIDNEISLVYLYIVDKPLNFIFQDGEVEGMVKVRLTDFERLCTGEMSSVDIELIIVDDYTAVPLEAMNLDHIVPHETSYFVKVIDEIRFKI